jgi:flavin-binding protein dodecin
VTIRTDPSLVPRGLTTRAAGDEPAPGRSSVVGNLTAYESERRRPTMAVAKVIEITASSPTSFEDAVRVGITRAEQTLEQVEGAWIQEQKVVVENGRITEFRVNMKVTFVLKEGA